MIYEEFIRQKTHLSGDFGFTPTYMPDMLFDFQKFLVEWSCKKGRAAIFADCGTGKTPEQLTWAENIVHKTNGRILILTPLAVAFQTVLEGQKFGVEVIHRREGIKSNDKVVVTNYERLHYFNPNDFQGIVCDECFPQDTPVDVFNIENSLTCKYIKDVSIGDKIFNANGEDYVEKIGKKQVNRAVRVNVNGRKVVCSENHSFFTLHGWKCAQDLQSGDNILETRTAVRLVWEDIQPEICRTENATILRNILLSEMENEHTKIQGKGTQPGSICKKRIVRINMEEKQRPESNKRNGTNNKFESDVKPRNKIENVCIAKKNKTQTLCAWRKRPGYDATTTNNGKCSVRELDSGICHITGEEEIRFSNMLQSRFRESSIKNSHRGRWSYPQIEKKPGYKKRQYAGFFRVESIEILELGHPDLEKYRDEDGNIYFYDIKTKRHPSFSVNGCLVHNSSILKNPDGIFRRAITDFMRKKPYRLLCTATAAPNDFLELGTSSEAIGEMGFSDMLSTFFKKSKKTYSRKDEHRTGTYHFRGHSEERFWRWVCSWARTLRRPSDLGFNNNSFNLPELQIEEHIVKAKTLPDGFLFEVPAVGLSEQRNELRRTIGERCEKAAELINAHDKPAIAWCHLIEEGHRLEKLIKGAVNVEGKDPEEKKEEAFKAFINGDIRVLVSKPTIAGFGLNLQHCAHMTFFPSHSFEQFYQCTRRCWRFGQKNLVKVDVISTEGQRDVLKNLKRKSEKANKMFDMLIALMKNELNIVRDNNYIKKEDLPPWL